MWLQPEPAPRWDGGMGNVVIGKRKPLAGFSNRPTNPVPASLDILGCTPKCQASFVFIKLSHCSFVSAMAQTSNCIGKCDQCSHVTAQDFGVAPTLPMACCVSKSFGGEAHSGQNAIDVEALQGHRSSSSLATL